jgi:hypothetical protein
MGDSGEKLWGYEDDGDIKKKRPGRRPPQATIDGLVAAARARKGKPGRKHTDESKAKLSRAARRRWQSGEGIGHRAEHSDEARMKIGDSLRGREFSAEHRGKLRLAKLGKKQPAEHVANRVAARLVNRNRDMFNDSSE